MRRSKKSVAAIAAVAIAAAVGIGGTIAYLTDVTEAAVNTFTVGNVDIDLGEATGDEYKMVPGTTLDKDPVVIVEGGSEDCWLFVRIVESGGEVTVDGAACDFDSFIAYGVADGWRPLEGESGVYWREAKAGDSSAVLADDLVEVRDTVSKEMMDALEAAYDAVYKAAEGGEEAKAEAAGAVLPRLSFTAYAVQKAGFDTASAAWAATFGA